jgi:hypothetical protein
MGEPNDCGSADEHTEQTEVPIGRREVVGEGLTRLAKYTAPVMLAALMSSSVSNKAFATTSGSSD